MDIQLYATDEELKEFPEDEADFDTTPNNNILQNSSDLSLPLTFLMLKDIYAKKPKKMVAKATGVAQGASAPFTHICSPTASAPKAQSDASLEDRVLQLTETLYHIDLNGKPPRKPFKHFITQPRRRFKPGHNRPYYPPNGRSFQPDQCGK